MNPYNFSVLFFSFGTCLVAFQTLLKRRDKVTYCFLSFSIFVVMWGIGFAFMTNATTQYQIALYTSRFLNGSAVFICVTWAHFVFNFLGFENKKNQIIVLYIFGAILAAFAFTPWFVPYVSADLKLGFRWYTRPGLAFLVFTGLFFTVVPYGFLLMLSSFRKAKGEHAIQIKALMIATLFGFIGGSFTFVPVYIPGFPLFGIFLMPFYPLLMSYAMNKHKLFDINQIAQAFHREKLATIGLLAASVNHEIRNPLYAAQSILENFLENKKEGLDTKNPEEVSKKALNQIRRSLEVITKLNRFAKPSDDSIAQNQTASVREAVQNVLDLISYEFSADKIQIESRIPNDFPSIRTDQRQLEEILFNLIVNACYAMESGGTLVIACEAKQSIVQITIQDSGVGIPPEQANHLFEPFYTTKGEKGTGLGLYITKQLVERNGGKISFSSKPNQGTSFTLEFKALQN